MNERIGKLAVEAGAHWEHGDWNMPSAVYFSERDLEKFALLIVQKCADIGQQYADGNYEVYNQILEHFGVEE
jgi:hypothetical protein